MALDEDPAAARTWAREEIDAPLTFTVLVDRDHVVAERYGIINIPTAIWIDEQGRVVRPPAITPADDRFREFTNIDSSVHHDALRRWVVDGVPPVSAHDVTRRRPPSPELQMARTERRLAMHLRRLGHLDAARTHLERALELAPDDWTIQRGSMPVRGMDPFGPEFFAFYERWQAAGRPGY